MSITLTLPAVLSSLLLSVPQGSSLAGSLGDAGGPLAYEVRLRGSETLLGYAWDSGARIPSLRNGPVVWLEFGERGLQPGSRLYLPGNTLSESALTGATNVVQQRVAFTAGRFGQALSFAKDTYLHIALAPQALPPSGWSLSFWLRPESGARGRTLLLLGGAADVALLSDGRVRATLDGGGSVYSPSAIPTGEWTFVHLSYDPLFLRQLRLNVAGKAANLFLAPGAPPRTPDNLKAGDLGRGANGFVGTIDDLSLEPRPASTTGALAVGSPLPASGAHRLEWTTTLGQRTAAPAAGATRELELDGAADFAQGALDGVAVVGNELRWVPGRWRRLETLLAPAPRTTHPLVSLGGGRVFTFGGETRDTHLPPMVNTADTWIFDGPAGAWERVTTTSAPSPRCHMPAAYSPDHDLVLLAGGWQNDTSPGQVFDDTWVYHVTQRRWERRFPGGPALGRSSDHGLVYLPALQQFLLLRGQQNWLYDPTADVWQRLPPAGAVDENGRPTAYTFGSGMAALDPATGLVLAFGGAYGSPPSVFSDTTALYDVATNNYVVLAPPEHPSPRVRSGFAHDPRLGVFVLFGGVQDQYSQRMDDLWVFDPRTRRWSEIHASNMPTRRGGYYGMGYDERSDRFVLACGRASPDRWLDDTWLLALDDRRAGTALYTFDRLEGGLRSSWFADADTPGDSQALFLFRHGDSGAEWSRWRPAGAALGNARFVQVAALLKPGSNGEVPAVRRMGFR